MNLRTVFVVLALALSAAPLAAEPSITVAWRFDDYSGTVIDNVDMGILDAFRKHHLRCTFAALPNGGYVPISAEKLAILKSAVDEGIVDVAVHGWTHSLIAPIHGSSGIYGSEFKGIAYGEQMYRIRMGKEFLEKGLLMPMTMFVPPFNSYDCDTVRVLESLGFTCLSASLGTGVPPDTRLKLVPDTVELTRVAKAVELARKNADGTPTLIVVLGHAYEFKEDHAAGGSWEEGGVSYSLAQLSKDLDWLQAQKDVRVLSLGQVLDQAPDLGAGRFLANREVYEQADRVPPFLRSRYPDVVYFTTDRARSVRASWATLLWSCYTVAAAVAAVVAFVFAAAVYPRIGRGKWVFVAGATVLLAIALAMGAPHGFHSWRAVLAATVLLGAAAGFWLGLLRRRRSAAA